MDLTGLSGVQSTLGAAISINPGTGLGGELVDYDPRGVSEIQKLGAAVERTDSFEYTIIDFGAGPINLYADGGGGTTRIESPGHRLVNVVSIEITGSSVPAYNGTHNATRLDDDNFSIPVAFVAATGGSWTTTLPRTPSGSSTATVSVRLIGVNDPPSPANDTVSTDEETIIRILGDPDLAGTDTAFDTDSAYPLPRTIFAGGGLLENDGDIDTDDISLAENAADPAIDPDETNLRIIGVGQVTEITGYARAAGGAAVAVTSLGHGLADGHTILISGYDGDPGYNGFHEVEIIDADTFTIPVEYFDNVADADDVWGILTDDSRLATTSVRGAAVALEIRSDRIETNIVYNPRTSECLNGLALNETGVDSFWYAVEDSHGAASFAKVTINVAGVNDDPIPVPDPPGLAGIDPALLGGSTLRQFITGAGVDFVVRDNGTGTGALLVGTPPQTIFVELIPVTDEDTSIRIPRTDITGNDSDVDRTDMLTVAAVGSPSSHGASLRLDGADILYDPSASTRLNSLAREESLVDAFEVTITDSNGGNIPSIVAVLVIGLNDTPVANDDTATTPEDTVLVIGPPGVLQNDTDDDQDGSPPDDDLTLITLTDAPTSVVGAKFSTSGKTLTYDPSGSAFLDGLGVGQTHADTFNYTATDSSFVFATDDLFKVAADVEVVQLDVISNDRNLTGSGTPLTIVAVGQPSSGGSAQLATDGSITYTPPVSFAGDEYFTYSAIDGAGRVDRALVTVRVTINQLNGNLQANDDAFSVAWGQVPLLDVLANDNIIPATGSGFTITRIVGVPDQGGSAVIESGNIRYTPGAGLGYKPDGPVVRYENAGAGATAVVSLAHRLADGDSIQIAGSGEAAYNGTHTVTALDADSFTIPVAFVSNPASPGNWVTDRGTQRDTETFSYEVSGGGTSRATATVSVVVIDRTHTLNVRDDALSVRAGSTDNLLLVLTNDNILPGSAEALTIATTSDPANGRVEISTDRTGVLYTPTVGFIGSDMFTYEASDGLGGTGTGTVTISVGNLATNNDIFSVPLDKANDPEGDGITVLDVLANDQVLQGAGVAVSITGVTPANPALGTMSVTAGGASLDFDPAEGQVGEQVFTYTVQDNSGGEATGQVTVVVIERGLNGSPDFFTVLSNSTANELDVLLNDAAAPDRGRTLAIVAITDPPSEGGLAEINTDGDRIVYSPPEGFTGEETLTYSVTDADSTDTATAVIKVGGGVLSPSPDAFTVYVGSLSNRLEVLANDRVLPDGGQLLAVTGVGIDDTNATNAPNQQGDAEISADGAALEYTPRDLNAPFVERFTYEVSDGTQRRAFQTVEITVLNRTSARDIDTNDDAFTVLQSSVSNVLDVLANDNVRPASAAGWQITNVTPPTHGAAVVVGQFVFYTPPADFVGTAMFSYSVSDGVGGTGMGDVKIKVGDTRVCPDRFVVLSGTVDNTLDVLANDGIRPADNPRTDFTLGTDPITPANGTARVENGMILYSPNAGFVGLDTFTYWIVDDSGGMIAGIATVDVQATGSDRDTATVAVTVTGVNDAPTIDVSGAIPMIITDKGTGVPFDGVVLIEVDKQGQQIVKVIVRIDDPASGVFTNLGGFVEIGPGVYQFEGTAAAATIALQGLRFDPVEDWVMVTAPPVAEDFGFTLSIMDNDPVITEPLTSTDTSLSIGVTAVNDPPTIAGAIAGLQVYHRGSIRAFVGVLITEIDDHELQQLTVDVALDDATHGILVSLSGVFTDLGGGVYRFVGTAAEATMALMELLSVPTTADRLQAGLNPADSETTRFTIRVDDHFGGVAGDDTTTVTAIHGYIAELTALDGSLDDKLGWSVAASRDVVVAGAPEEDDQASDAGAAYVFTPANAARSEWQETAKLAATDGRVGDMFGSSVGVSGDLIVVGSPHHLDLGTASGSAYIFQLQAGTWNQIAKLTPADGNNGDEFGVSLAFSGDTILVGSRRDDNRGLDAGSVYIYERNQGGAGNWGLVKTIHASDPENGDQFGYALSIDADTAIVGAPFDDPIRTNSGSAYIYERNLGGAGNWGFSKKLVPIDGDLNDEFGNAVDVSGDRVVVGAHKDNVEESDSGSAYIFARNLGGAGQWGRHDKITAPGRRGGDRFGASVGIEGDELVIGMSRDGEFDDDDENPNNNERPMGFAYLYRLSDGPSQLLEEIATLDLNDDKAVGFSVAIGGHTVAVGIPFENPPGFGDDPGAVLIYRLKFNNAPVVKLQIPEQVAEVSRTFLFNASEKAIGDPDTLGSVTYAASLAGGALPSWLSLDPDTGIFSGTPGAADLGTVVIDLVGTDEHGLAAQTSFTIRVVPPALSLQDLAQLSQPSLSIETMPSGAGVAPFAVLRFVGLTAAANTGGLFYLVESSINLIDWEPADGSVTPGVAVGQDFQQFIWTSLDPTLGVATQYYRLRISTKPGTKQLTRDPFPPGPTSGKPPRTKGQD